MQWGKLVHSDAILEVGTAENLLNQGR